MMMDCILKSYQEENLIGSYCTAPLRAFNTSFQNKMQVIKSAYERTAWTVVYVVSGIFAYLTLGVLAVVGVVINLCLIPPKNGYSLWARLNGVSRDTEEFCEKIASELSSSSMGRAEDFSGSVNLSIGRGYTYHLNRGLFFEIQNVCEDVPSPGVQVDGLRIEEVNDAEESIYLEQDDRSLQSQFSLRRMESYIIYIQNFIRTLSQKHGWVPEKQFFRREDNRITVIIPLPDHISIPTCN